MHMEEKTIVITEKAENQILGQEAVFGWTMKEKRDAGKFLFFKYNQYTLTRDRKEEEVTQAHRDVENRWNNEFNIWNKFILNGFKKTTIANILSILMVLVGFILMLVGLGSIDARSTSLPGSFIAGLIIMLVSLVISIAILVVVSKNGAKRLKHMDEISRDMRQVNAIRNNK